MDVLAGYRALVASPEATARCREARDLPGFLQVLRERWGLAGVADDALLGALEQANRQVLDLPAAALAGHWFPASYRAADRTLAWCLPGGPPTEPFLADSQVRWRDGGAAWQLLRPRTPLPGAGEVAGAPAPAGFILHLSRCGSTLVSGTLAELDETVVLSESPLLTGFLLDAGLDEATRCALLPALVALQAACFAPRARVVVKWNAWDLFAWPTLRAAFPGVPCLLLSRDPVEILASHAREAGRHMAGDPSLAALHPVFGPPPPGADLLGQRIAVLRALWAAMARAATEPGSLSMDYAQLDAEGLARIRAHFGLPTSPAAEARIAARLSRHSKFPHQPFAPDTPRKQHHFDPPTRTRIQNGVREH